MIQMTIYWFIDLFVHCNSLFSPGELVDLLSSHLFSFLLVFSWKILSHLNCKKCIENEWIKTLLQLLKVNTLLDFHEGKIFGVLLPGNTFRETFKWQSTTIYHSLTADKNIKKLNSFCFLLHLIVLTTKYLKFFLNRKWICCILHFKFVLLFRWRMSIYFSRCYVECN